jgi:hypothetical protein
MNANDTSYQFDVSRLDSRLIRSILLQLRDMRLDTYEPGESLPIGRTGSCRHGFGLRTRS